MDGEILIGIPQGCKHAKKSNTADRFACGSYIIIKSKSTDRILIKYEKVGLQNENYFFIISSNTLKFLQDYDIRIYCLYV